MVMPFIGLWKLSRDACRKRWNVCRKRWNVRNRSVVKMFPGAMTVGCQNAVLCLFFFAASIRIGKFESQTYHFPIFFLWTHQELDGSKAKKSERIIFERIIVVKVERGDVPCLDLVDLPGLVKLPKDKVPLAAGMEMLTWQDSKFTPKLQKMKNWTTTIIAVAFKLSLMLKSLECSWIGNRCIFSHRRQSKSIRSMNVNFKRIVPTAINACTWQWCLLQGKHGLTPIRWWSSSWRKVFRPGWSSCHKCWVKIFTLFGSWEFKDLMGQLDTACRM